jgi:hypothetical protein
MNWRSGAVDLALCTLLSFVMTIGMPPCAGAAGMPGSQDSSTTTSQDDQKADAALKLGYKGFILGQGMDDQDYLAKTEAGKARLVPRFSYTKFAHTSPDEEETIHSIIFAAYSDLRTNDAQYQSTMEELHQQGFSAEQDAKMNSAYEERAKKEMYIVQQAMTQLKQTLTEEDFQRLDLYVHLLERIGK